MFLGHRAHCLAAIIAAISPLPISTSAQAASLPAQDERAGPPKTLNTRWTFPSIESKAAWQDRAAHIRRHILVSCGLWPMPEKPSLNAQVFDRIERDGYSLEKVAIQTYPGFYLAGNLYRPRGQGSGPFPAILNPHGHWGNGRFEDTETGSIAARCIQFARLGMIAFSYDMVGYGDTHQVGAHRQFATHPTNQLWNISLMGLQTWNSIRALDFLESLPDVDAERLGCTGASGGGTQTFMLGAIEDRLAVQAPNVMVSCSMQGGCLCENAPGLRLDFSNMEIAAAAAPRPQILVAATGDWTKETMTVEGPGLESVYRLFDAEDHLRYQRFDFPHNYNRTSREAVYRWFARWLTDIPNPESIEEQPLQVEPRESLSVWQGRALPENAVDANGLTAYLVAEAQRQLDALKPRDRQTLRAFRETMQSAWHHTLALGWPRTELVAEANATSEQGDLTIDSWSVGRAGQAARLPVKVVSPPRVKSRYAALLVHPQGMSIYLNDQGNLQGLAADLVRQGQIVVLADVYQTGRLADASAAESRDPKADLFTTYNRTDLQERVRDLVTLCDFARRESGRRRVVICGEDSAGWWALLAAPAADAVAADAHRFDTRDDSSWLQRELFTPGLRRLGGFDGVAALASPHPLLIHNTGSHFDTSFTEATYRASRGTQELTVDVEPRSPENVARWILSL